MALFPIPGEDEISPGIEMTLLRAGDLLQGSDDPLPGKNGVFGLKNGLWPELAEKQELNRRLRRLTQIFYCCGLKTEDCGLFFFDKITG